jgi:hypothetical protein
MEYRHDEVSELVWIRGPASDEIPVSTCHFTVSPIPRLEGNSVIIFLGVFVIARYQLL